MSSALLSSGKGKGGADAAAESMDFLLKSQLDHLLICTIQ